MSDSHASRRIEDVSAAAASEFVGQTLAVRAEQFCDRYAPAVCRFAAMAARTPSEADDIAQEALLRALLPGVLRERIALCDEALDVRVLRVRRRGAGVRSFRTTSRITSPSSRQKRYCWLISLLLSFTP